MLLNNYKLTSTHEFMRFAVLWILLLAILQPLLIDTDYSELSDDFNISFSENSGVEVISELEPNDSLSLIHI